MFDGLRFTSVGIGGDGVPSPRATHLAWEADGDALWVAFEDGRLQRRGPEGSRVFERLGNGAPTLARGPSATWYLADGGALYRLDDEPQVAIAQPGASRVRVDAEGAPWLLARDGWVALDEGLRPREPSPDPPPRESLGWRLVEGGLLELATGTLVPLDEHVNDLEVHEDAVWVATRGQGLLQLRPRRVDAVPAPDGLSRRVLRVWYEAATDVVWAQSDPDVWWNVEAPYEQLRPVGLQEPLSGEAPLPPEALPLTLDGVGRWWAAQGRIRREDPSTGALAEVDGSPRFWEALEAWTAPDGQTWLGTVGSIFRWTGLEWVELRRPDGEPHLGVRAFASLPDGSVLFGSASGLGWASGDGQAQEPPLPAAQPSVRHVRVDGDHVWLATDDRGLCVVETAGLPQQLGGGSGWRCLDQALGLGTHGVHTSTDDGHGRVWVSANRGLGWAESASLRAFAVGDAERVPFLWLGREHGMRSAETNGSEGRAVAVTPEGVLWYPSQDGAVALTEERVPAPEAPAVTLAADAARDDLVVVEGGESVTLTWAAGALDWPSDLVFRYRLGEAPWSRPRDARSLVVEELPVGRRSFQVQAGLGGAWGQPAALVLDRLPTFWERGLVRITALAAGLGLMVGLVGLRLRQVQRRREDLEETVRVATQDLRARSEELRALYGHSQAQAARLEQLDQVKRKLLANVSHELRTPLSLIIGPLDALHDSLHGRERERAALALRNAERMEALVDQLLELARAQTGSLRLRVRRGSLLRHVRAVLERFEGVVLEGKEGLTLWFDPEMLDTIVGNLVANAQEHGDGAVIVTVSREGDSALVAVRDHGAGLAGARDPFERLAQRSGSAGLGLGLSLVSELVALHGGEVGAEEAAPGSRFWFTLPLGVQHLALEDVDADDGPATEHDAPDPGGGAARILLVEDNDELRAFMAEQLRLRFRVADVASAEAALPLLAGGRVDLLVSDIMLPGMSGLELARRRPEGVPVLLVSAKGHVDTRVEGLQVADDFLGKPFRIRELLARCDLLLRRRPAAESQGDERTAAERQFLERLERYADAELGRSSLTAEDLARAVGVSRRNLHDRMRALGLLAAGAWLRERRMVRAEALIREGAFETVGEVAAAVGLSRAWFTRAFTARTGVSPGSALKRR